MSLGREVYLSVCVDVDHGRASREGWQASERVAAWKSWSCSGKPKQVREGKGRPCGPGPDFVSPRVPVQVISTVKRCAESSRRRSMGC